MIKKGRGTACGIYPITVNNAPNPCSANVLMREDGSLNIQMGIVDMGQGAQTALSMIAAEYFSIPVEKVQIYTADTHTTPYDFGSISSRITMAGGRALLAACEELLNVIRTACSKKLGTEPSNLVCRNAMLVDETDPSKKMPLAAAAGFTQYACRMMPIGQGVYYPFNIPTDEYGQGEPSVAYHYHASLAEVEVDDETGVVTVKDIWNVIDCGKAINPEAVKGQCDGGTLQGTAWAMGEDMYPYLTSNNGPTAEFNPDFRPRNLSDYPIPTAMDAPRIHSDYVECPDIEGPFGAKGAGEVCANTAAPAIINAIHDAVGIWITELPATPEKVLRALNEKEGK